MCGLAVALDYLGDRWTLLIVRELLVEPRTFSQLQSVLRGCSPNLLVDRLKDMSANGLILQKARSTSTRMPYQLTELGRSLRGPVESLIRWGGRLIPGQRGLKDRYPHWMEVAIPALLRPKIKANERFRIQFQIDKYVFAVISDGVHLDVIKGETEQPDLILNLSYQRTLAVLSGYVSLKSLASDEITSTKYNSKAKAVKRLQEILS
jgi:DNA-binding HxlR family transcriptional regulator